MCRSVSRYCNSRLDLVIYNESKLHAHVLVLDDQAENEDEDKVTVEAIGITEHKKGAVWHTKTYKEVEVEVDRL